jgi:hypothetical protein
MGTQIAESEPCICSCSLGSRTWVWYQMNHKPGKRATRRVRGPYLNYSVSTTPLLAAEHTNQQCAKQKVPPRWVRARDGESCTCRRSNEQREWKRHYRPPHGQSQIYMEEVWVGSQAVSKNSEYPLTSNGIGCSGVSSESRFGSRSLVGEKK